MSNVGLSATAIAVDSVKGQEMKGGCKNLFVQLLLGLVSSSLLAALCFRIAVRLLGSDFGIETAAPGAPALLAEFATWLFEASLVFVIGFVVGVPSFLLARRLDVANAYAACGVGLAIGVLVSFLYGAADPHSLSSILYTAVTFGLPGLIAGATFWAFARPVSARGATKSQGCS